MAIGSTFQATGRAGNQLWRYRALAGSLITAAGVGFGPTVVGIGYQTIRGVGRHSIMGAGFTTTRSAGAGLQIMFGDHPGFAGDTRTITAVGRLCLLVQFMSQA